MEDYLECIFQQSGPFWHLCTPGTNQEILFRDDDDYRFGITSAALSLDGSVRIYALAVMSNHLHDILAGAACECLAYFERRKKLLKKYLDTEGKDVDLREFIGKLLPIEVKGGAVHIPSFVRVREGEGWFRDAHQYFHLLSRNREAYGEVAKRLGDEVFLTDNELFDAVCAHCRSRFGQPRPSALSPDDKISLAVLMKQEYNASNGQIRRMLRLDDRVVRELFPEWRP